jgi:type IV secretion system protein VirD4
MGTGALDLHRARFAQFLELRGLLSRTPEPDGMLLGLRRDFLFFNRFVVVRPTKTRREIGNTLVVAPTRGGKGLLAVSQLLTWQHSVMVNDIKGELFAQTAGYRSTLGRVYVIDPTGCGHCFDPLQGKKTEDKLFSAAFSMLFEAEERERIWTEKAARMLQQLFLAAKREETPALVYVRHMSRRGLPEVAQRLNTVDPALASQFLDAAFEQADFSSKFLQSGWSTLTTKLHPFLTETVVRSLTHSDFTPEQIIRGNRPVTVYLRWKEQDLLALSPLVRLVWSSLIYELIDIYDTHQGNGCRSVLLLIDEAGRTAIPMLDSHATTVVGRGISLWIAVQSLSQLEAAYGKARAQILMNNMETQLYYRPADLATAEYIERCLGRHSAYAHSQTLRDGEESSQGLSEQGIPLLTAQDIRQMKDEDVIGFHRNLKPFQMKRMDWRHSSELQRKRGIPAPTLPALPQIADIPEQPGASQTIQPPDEYINPDMLHTRSKTSIIDLFRREQRADRLN